MIKFHNRWVSKFHRRDFHFQDKRTFFNCWTNSIGKQGCQLIYRLVRVHIFLKRKDWKQYSHHWQICSCLNCENTTHSRIHGENRTDRLTNERVVHTLEQTPLPHNTHTTPLTSGAGYTTEAAGRVVFCHRSVWKHVKFCLCSVFLSNIIFKCVRSIVCEWLWTTFLCWLSTSISNKQIRWHSTIHGYSFLLCNLLILFCFWLS